MPARALPDGSPSTPVSLLERVRKQTDREAWSRFVTLFSPLIFYWGRKNGLQPQDAADLTQDVFTTLFQKLPDFDYDRHKSFRCLAAHGDAESMAAICAKGSPRGPCQGSREPLTSSWRRKKGRNWKSKNIGVTSSAGRCG